MKRVKVVLIAAAATMALTAAFASASASAAATVLCKEAVNPCPASEVLPAGSYLPTVVSSGNLGTNFSLNETGFSCKFAIMSSRTTAEMGNPFFLPAEGEAYLVGEQCSDSNFSAKYPEEECSVTIGNVPEQIASSSGTSGAVYIGTTSQPLTIGYKCIFEPSKPAFYVECTYAASGSAKYVITGGIWNGTGKIENVPMKLIKPHSGAACIGTGYLNVNSVVEYTAHISTY